MLASQGASAQGGKTVQFGCDAPKGHICHFILSFASGTAAKSFTVDGGMRTVVSGVVPNADSYVVAIDRDPPSNPEQCGLQFPCKRVFVNAGYNN
jgi:hypothetical protein